MGKFSSVIKEFADKEGSEEKMWQSVAVVDDVMSLVESAHPDEYKEIMERVHVVLYGKHFDETCAKKIVSEMRHTDKHGAEHSGEHYTFEQAKSVREQYLPNENCYDVYVALNATWHDFEALYSEWFSAPSDQHFIKTMVRFWYEDEDYPNSEKVWEYFKKA